MDIEPPPRIRLCRVLPVAVKSLEIYKTCYLDVFPIIISQYRIS